MTETITGSQQDRDQEQPDTASGGLSGVDLARVALHQAREAAKTRGASGSTRKAKRASRTAGARRDGREVARFGAVLQGLLADRAWDIAAAGGESWTSGRTSRTPSPRTCPRTSPRPPSTRRVGSWTCARTRPHTPPSSDCSARASSLRPTTGQGPRLSGPSGSWPSARPRCPSPARPLRHRRPPPGPKRRRGPGTRPLQAFTGPSRPTGPSRARERCPWTLRRQPRVRPACCESSASRHSPTPRNSPTNSRRRSTGPPFSGVATSPPPRPQPCTGPEPNAPSVPVQRFSCRRATAAVLILPRP